MQAKVSGLESELEGLRLELAASKAAAEQLRTEQEQLRAKHEQELEQQRQHQQELEQKQATLLAAQQDPKPASATRYVCILDPPHTGPLLGLCIGRNFFNELAQHVGSCLPSGDCAGRRLQLTLTLLMLTLSTLLKLLLISPS
jgi:hypothetical protein